MDKATVTKIAVEMVKANGLLNLDRVELCKRAGIPDGSFKYTTGCTFSELVVELDEMKIEQPEDVEATRSRANNPKHRKEQIFMTAVKLAQTHGYHNITREQIAAEIGVSGGLVGKYFTMTKLTRDILQHAADNEILEIIAQGLLNHRPTMKALPQELKDRAVQAYIAETGV